MNREKQLPKIIKNSEMKSYLKQIPDKEESVMIPNL